MNNTATRTERLNRLATPVEESTSPSAKWISQKNHWFSCPQIHIFAVITVGRQRKYQITMWFVDLLQQDSCVTHDSHWWQMVYSLEDQLSTDFLAHKWQEKGKSQDTKHIQVQTQGMHHKSRNQHMWVLGLDLLRQTSAANHKDCTPGQVRWFSSHKQAPDAHFSQ